MAEMHFIMYTLIVPAPKSQKVGNNAIILILILLAQYSTKSYANCTVITYFYMRMSEDEAQICIWPKIFTRHMVLDIFRNTQLTMLKTGSRQRNANAAVGQAAKL